MKRLFAQSGTQGGRLNKTFSEAAVFAPKNDGEWNKFKELEESTTVGAVETAPRRAFSEATAIGPKKSTGNGETSVENDWGKPSTEPRQQLAQRTQNKTFTTGTAEDPTAKTISQEILTPNKW